MSCVFYVIANKAEKLHCPDQIEPNSKTNERKNTKHFQLQNVQREKIYQEMKKRKNGIALTLQIYRAHIYPISEQPTKQQILNNSVIVYRVALAFFRR